MMEALIAAAILTGICLVGSVIVQGVLLMACHDTIDYQARRIVRQDDAIARLASFYVRVAGAKDLYDDQVRHTN